MWGLLCAQRLQNAAVSSAHKSLVNAAALQRAWLHGTAAQLAAIAAVPHNPLEIFDRSVMLPCSAVPLGLGLSAEMSGSFVLQA